MFNFVCSKVMFALQIGSWRQLPTCNVQLDGDLPDGKVLLQYTRNKVNMLSILFVCIGILSIVLSSTG